MSRTGRKNFLDRVATAVRSGNKHRETAPCQSSASLGFVGAGDDPIARLVEELIKVGVNTQRVVSREDTARAVRSIIDQYSIRSALVNTAGIVVELDIVGVLSAAGVEVTTPKELALLDESARRDRLFAADLGVAAPDWVVAETGSLVYASASEQTRSTTLLPPVHLAVVDASRVLADLFDLPMRLVERSADGVLPRNIVLVTGPSKTGDIELKLTTGVHGPGEVHVLIGATQ